MTETLNEQCPFNPHAYDSIEVDGIIYHRRSGSLVRQPLFTFKEDQIYPDWDFDNLESFRWHPDMEALRFGHDGFVR